MKSILISKLLNKNIHYLIKCQTNNKFEGNIGKNEAMKNKKLNEYKILIEKKRMDFYTIWKQKIRMKKIIDLCDINNNENKKWIIILENVTENYKKLFKFEEDNLSENIKKIRKIQKYTNNYVNRFNENINLNYDLIEKFKESCIKKNEIDNNILKTEFLTENYIKNKIINNKSKIDEKNLNEIEKHEKLKNREKLELLNEELKKYELLDKEYYCLFNDNNEYYETDEFKKLVENLENKREFEFKLIQLLDKNDILKKKKEIIKKQLKEFKIINNKELNNSYNEEIKEEFNGKYNYKDRIEELNSKIDRKIWETKLLVKKKWNIQNTLASFNKFEFNSNEDNKIIIGDNLIKNYCNYFEYKLRTLKEIMEPLDFEWLLFNKLDLSKF